MRALTHSLTHSRVVHHISIGIVIVLFTFANNPTEVAESVETGFSFVQQAAMSYNRPFFEKIGNIFNYSKWKAPNFPAGGERESIPGHVFELYLEASPPASNSTAEQEAADIVTDSSSAAEDVAPVEVSPKKRKLLELAKRATVLVENDCVVFRDRSPVAPVHLLVGSHMFCILIMLVARAKNHLTSIA